MKHLKNTFKKGEIRRNKVQDYLINKVYDIDDLELEQNDNIRTYTTVLVHGH